MNAHEKKIAAIFERARERAEIAQNPLNLSLDEMAHMSKFWQSNRNDNIEPRATRKAMIDVARNIIFLADLEKEFADIKMEEK